jgi:hypothetical protein
MCDKKKKNHYVSKGRAHTTGEHEKYEQRTERKRQGGRTTTALWRADRSADTLANETERLGTLDRRALQRPTAGDTIIPRAR